MKKRKKRSGLLAGIFWMFIISAIATVMINLYLGNITVADLHEGLGKAGEVAEETVEKVKSSVMSLTGGIGNILTKGEKDVVIESAPPEQNSVNDGIDYHGPYEVIRVVDGDTIVVSINGREERVRFIGVDTPESVNPDESKNTPEGKIASDFTKELLVNHNVYLEYDVSPTDKYDRLLAYVYLEDKETMAQEILLKQGLASTMTIQPNSKYAARFAEIQKQARESGEGFWESGFFSD